MGNTEISGAFDQSGLVVEKLPPVDENNGSSFSGISSVSDGGTDNTLVSIERVTGHPPRRKTDSSTSQSVEYDETEKKEDLEEERGEKEEEEVRKKGGEEGNEEEGGENKEEGEGEEEEVSEEEEGENDEEEEEEEVVQEEEEEEEEKEKIMADEVISKMIEAKKDLESHFSDEERRNNNMKAILRYYEHWEDAREGITELIESQKTKLDCRNNNNNDDELSEQENIERLENLRSECMKIQPNQPTDLLEKNVLRECTERIKKMEQQKTLKKHVQEIKTLVEKYKYMHTAEKLENLTEVEQACDNVHELNDLCERFPDIFTEKGKREEWGEKINTTIQNLPRIKETIQKESQNCQFLLDSVEQQIILSSDNNNNFEDDLEKIRGFLIYWDRVLLLVGLYEEESEENKYIGDGDESFVMRRIRRCAKQFFKKYQERMEEMKSDDPNNYNGETERLKKVIEKVKKSVDECFDGGIEELYNDEIDGAPEYLKMLNYEDACTKFSQMFGTIE